jgi:hypothetical protein
MDLRQLIMQKKKNQRKKEKETFCRILVEDQDSIVSIVTSYKLDGLGIESWWG